MPIFEFIGGYWWLVFPLFGVLASVGGAWERGARRRHRRRLEVLHAKAELKAAQAAARGRVEYPAMGAPPNPASAGFAAPPVYRELPLLGPRVVGIRYPDKRTNAE